MSEEGIENITKPESNFVKAFVDHHVLSDVNFKGHCLIKNNISLPKKVINFLDTRSTIKKFKNRFYIR